MPEGDTVWRTARTLHRALAGEPLTRFDLRWGEAATLDLTGRTTLEVVSRGKHILHRIEGGVTVHSHLRMDGQWRVEHASGDSYADHRVRAVVGTEQWTCIGRSLGMLDVVDTADEASLVGHLGPDLLGPDWDLDEALRRLRTADDVTVGAALLDQRLLAGIGTMYAAESLFLQRQHPWAPVGSLDDDTLRRLVERAHRLLTTNKDHAVQSSTGSRRRGEELYVHARSGRPCRRCGDTVRVAMIADPPRERTMFSCPTCQGGRGPTDDGRPQRPLGSSTRSRGRYR